MLVIDGDTGRHTAQVHQSDHLHSLLQKPLHLLPLCRGSLCLWGHLDIYRGVFSVQESGGKEERLIGSSGQAVVDLFVVVVVIMVVDHFAVEIVGSRRPVFCCFSVCSEKFVLLCVEHTNYAIYICLFYTIGLCYLLKILSQWFTAPAKMSSNVWLSNFTPLLVLPHVTCVFCDAHALPQFQLQSDNHMKDSYLFFCQYSAVDDGCL